MGWIEPIFDRTQEDVDLKTKKAYFNAVDYNRVNGNNSYLLNVFGVDKNYDEFNFGTIPYKANIEDILNDIDSIKSYWPVATLETPQYPINTFEKLNIVEYIQNFIYKNNLQTLDNQFRCGNEAFSGDRIGVL